MTSPASISTQSQCGMPSTRGVRDPGLFEALQHAVRDGADMAVRPAAGNHHGVSDRGLAGEIDGDGVLGLHVVEAVEDQAKGPLGVGTLGDGFGLAAMAGPRGCDG